jgi:hypothetical protein
MLVKRIPITIDDVTTVFVPEEECAALRVRNQQLALELKDALDGRAETLRVAEKIRAERDNLLTKSSEQKNTLNWAASEDAFLRSRLASVQGKLASAETDTKRRILMETKQVSEWLAAANARMLKAEDEVKKLQELHEQALNERDTAHWQLELEDRPCSACLHALSAMQTEERHRKEAEKEVERLLGELANFQRQQDLQKSLKGQDLAQLVAKIVKTVNRYEDCPSEDYADAWWSVRGDVRAHIAEQPAPKPEHHCGVMGWRPDLGDAPCPACEYWRNAAKAK